MCNRKEHAPMTANPMGPRVQYKDMREYWEYAINFRYEKPDETWLGSGGGHKELGPDYHPLRTMANRYLQDREEMKTQTFAGLGRYFYAHDAVATETAGPIQDRTR